MVWPVGLLAEAEAEGLDLAVYLRTVRGQLEANLAALVAGYTLEATVALRLLLYGDPSQNLPSTVIKP